MLPLTKWARTCTGREGSASGTATWLLSGPWAINSGPTNQKMTAAMNCIRNLSEFIGLVMAFQNAYVSIQIVCLDFHSSGADAASRIAISAKDEFAVATLAGGRLGRQRGHFEIGVDVPVHRLEAEVRRQATREIEVNGPIDAAEIGVLLGILAKDHLHAPIHGARQG